MEKRILALAFLSGLWAVTVGAQEAERDTIKMEITATNPSKDESQEVTIREPVPAGQLKKTDIKVPPELEIEFDRKTSLFYIVAKEREKEVDGKPVMKADGTPVMVRTIEMDPGQADLTFVVELKDVWYIKDGDMDGLERQANDAMSILEETEYRVRARVLTDGIIENFTGVRTFQADDSIDRKAYIAGYGNSVEKLNWARTSVEEMERYIRLHREQASPVMETEEEMPLPSKTATWLVIFIILVFLGILTGAFYFVWQRRAQLLEGALSEAQQAAFPETDEGPGEKEEGA